MAKSKNSAKDKPEESNSKSISRNRRAHHEYDLLEKIECGIALKGSEVKSLRNGKVSLDEAYAKIIDGELWLLGCDIAEYPQASMFNHEPRRNRKLLLHKRELKKFAATADHKGLTMIPLSMYFKEGIVKVEIAVGRGRKLHDKREALKKNDAAKEMRQAMARRR
ncbi:MAG: SsrA-binding protein SmpB [Planctomycetales bacterium]